MLAQNGMAANSSALIDNEIWHFCETQRYL
jgi:hypothetical protein